MKLDIGCGNETRPGFVGIDINAGCDLRCDLAHDHLPLADGCAEHIHASHFLEHIPQEKHLHVFREMTRVACDGALIELWHPYVFHRDAYVYGHVTLISEEPFVHLGDVFRTFWAPHLGAAWHLREIRYNVERVTLDDLTANDVSPEFAVCHLHNIVKELGILIVVDKRGDAPAASPRRVICSHPPGATVRAGRDNVVLVMGGR